ncbi:MAG: D-2-hydroxyacid dehydrogenase [Chitinivibrionales bacterium]|nr:D-2-hydroxyacid dehydrogenase [Chitinivibrionales bacterium]
MTKGPPDTVSPSPKPVVFVELHSDADALRIGPDALCPLESAFPQARFEYLGSFDELSRRIAEPHYVLCWRFPASLYARAKNLRAVFTPAAGHDWVAPDPAGAVPVSYGSFHGVMIAESLVAMMLHCNDRRTLMMRMQREHRWARNAQMPRRLLGSQRVLIVGYGRIGFHCARLLRAFGCEVTGMRRSPLSTADRALGVRGIGPEALMEELPQADHVVLLLPGGDETRGFFGERQLAAMRESAFLYNFGRGTVVDEDALVGALRSGAIAGAGLDVFAEEPLPPESPLWDLDNVLITPHSSCHYVEYGRLFADEVAGRLRAALQ